MWSSATFCIVLINNACSILFNETDNRNLFNKYKTIYNKTYDDTIEKYAFINFVRNLNDVRDINAGEGRHSYSLNKYADLDPKEVYERFGVTIRSYDYESNEKNPDIIKKNNPKQQDIQDSEMYDLENADEMYKKYKEIFDKARKPDNIDPTFHYYKFYSSLVKVNYKKLNGENAKINVTSDMLSETPNYYIEDSFEDK